MGQVSQIHSLLDRVQGLVWLAQALAQADTDVTQDILDKIWKVIELAQTSCDVVDSERNELDRILVQSSLSTLSTGGDASDEPLQRQTVDERDSFLNGLHQMLRLSER